MIAATAAAAAIDGGARGNPGEAGCGVVLDLPDRREEHTLYLGIATNNVAEYAALLAALERAQALGIESLDVRSDSQLLVEQMKRALQGQGRPPQAAVDPGAAPPGGVPTRRHRARRPRGEPRRRRARQPRDGRAGLDPAAPGGGVRSGVRGPGTGLREPRR